MKLVQLTLFLEALAYSTSVYYVSVSESHSQHRGSQNDPFSDLSEALSATHEDSSASLVLISGTFSLALDYTLQHFLLVLGNLQTISIDRSLTVADGSHLEVYNATVEQGSQSGGFSVYGRLILRYTELRGCVGQVVTVHAGGLEIRNSKLTNNTGAVVQVEGWSAEVELNQCEVTNHSNTFIDFSPQANSGTAKLLLYHCSFRYCSATYDSPLITYRVLANSAEKNGLLRVSQSEFRWNAVTLLAIRCEQSNVTIENTAIQRSSRPVFIVDQSASLFTLKSCNFTENSATLIDARGSGEVVWRDVGVSNQANQGLIRVSGGSGCYFSISDSDFRDSEIRSPDVSHGLIFATACTVSISRINVSRVRVVGGSGRMALIYSEAGALELLQAKVKLSGSSMFFLLGFMSSILVRDSSLERVIVGGNLVFGAIMGELHLRSTSIAVVEFNGDIYSDKAFGSPVMVGWTNNHVEITDLLLSNNTNCVYASLLTTSYSTYHIANITIDSLQSDVLLAQIDAEGLIEGMTIRNAGFRLFLIQTFMHSELSIVGMVMKEVTVSTPSHGCFCVASRSRLRVSQSTVDCVAAGFFLLASDADVNIADTTFEQVDFHYIIGNTNQAVLALSNVVIGHSEGGIMHAFASELMMVESVVEGLIGGEMLFSVSSSEITMKGVKLRHIFSRNQLGKLYENSHLEVANCSFQYISSGSGEGFTLKDSSLGFSHSTVSNFHVTLFQALRSNATFSNSTFLNGVSPTQSLKSNSAYGGILGCVDCLSVFISLVSAFNVTSMAGGAFALRGINTDIVGKVIVQGSKFMLCNAMEGGAIFLRNVSLVIKSSSFIYNRASNHGGAITIDVDQTHERTISDCFFLGNVAVEGGAMKWRNAELNFADITFRENQAEYGPDVASFGVAISSRLTKLTVPPVSGQPLLLIFEVVDHYGNRVTTASNQVLTLQPSRTVTFGGNPSSISNKGVFRFQDAVVYAKPNSTQQVTVMMQESVHLTGSVELTFRNCTAGEIYRSTMCEVCLIGNVSYSPDDENCRVCPQRASCYGGTNMTVLKGNWRASTNSTTVLHCPLPSKCLGGVNSTCAEGFAGKLCAQCDRGRYRARLSDCAKCGNEYLIAAEVGAIALVFASFLVSVYWFAAKRKDEPRLFLIKAIANHAQMLSMTIPIRASYPPFLTIFLRVTAYFSSLQLTDLPIACVWDSDTEYIRTGLASTFAAVVFGLCIVLVVRRKGRVWTVMATSCLLFTPAIVVQTLAPLFACQQAHTRERWLYTDLSELCWGDKHFFFVKVVLVPSAFFNVLLPLISTSVTERLFPGAFRSDFPLWTAGYKQKNWECFLSLSKCCSLWIMFVTLTYNSIEQIAYGLITLIAISVINVSFQRHIYKSWVYFILSEMSVVVTAISLGLVSFYTFYSPSDGASDYFIVSTFGILNCGYFGLCIVLLRKATNAMFHPLFNVSCEEIQHCRVPNNSIIDEIREEGCDA